LQVCLKPRLKAYKSLPVLIAPGPKDFGIGQTGCVVLLDIGHPFNALPRHGEQVVTNTADDKGFGQPIGAIGSRNIEAKGFDARVL
jgi:hypothetical protein